MIRNYTLKNGVVKKYRYFYDMRKYKQHNKSIFDMLLEYEEIKEILKNNSVKNPDKLKFIIDFIKDKVEFNVLTCKQIKQFIYRNTTMKLFNFYNMLLSYKEVNEILNKSIPTNTKLNKIKDIIKDNKDILLTDTQILYFIEKHQIKRYRTLDDVLISYEEVKNIFKGNLTTGEKVEFIKEFIKNKEDFKEFNLNDVRKFVYKNNKKIMSSTNSQIH